MLFPALRLMRAQMRLVSDPLKLREAAARLDALGRPAPDVQVEPVIAGTAPASWVTVKGGRRDGVVLYLHGGAFIAETPTFHGALLGRICRESRCRGLMPSYRLSPEHRYPAALDDCVAAYRWLLAQGHEARSIESRAIPRVATSRSRCCCACATRACRCRPARWLSRR
jgi:acetyl esterase/lipase